MTTYAWPTAYAKHMPQTAALRVITNGRSNDGAESGVTQTVTRPGSKWGWSISMAPMQTAVRDDFEGWLVGLSGMEHRISTWDWKRPVPRGTINLTGITLGASAAQFATSVTLAGCGNAKTLLRGDWIGFTGGQLCRVAVDATSDSGGAMTVQIRHSLRSALSSGSAVTVNKPTALYILAQPSLELPRMPGPVQPGFSLDIVEVFS